MGCDYYTAASILEGWLVEVEILEPEQLKKLLNGEDYNKYLEATD